MGGIRLKSFQLHDDDLLGLTDSVILFTAGADIQDVQQLMVRWVTAAGQDHICGTSVSWIIPNSLLRDCCCCQLDQRSLPNLLQLRDGLGHALLLRRLPGMLWQATTGSVLCWTLGGQGSKRRPRPCLGHSRAHGCLNRRPPVQPVLTWLHAQHVLRVCCSNQPDMTHGVLDWEP